jgi:hypothetical protein
MASIPRLEIERALNKKGFSPRKGDHRFYSLMVDGRETSVRTKISTGTGFDDYTDDLLGKLKRQLHFRSLDALRDFIDCRLEYRDYLEDLRRQKVI